METCVTHVASRLYVMLEPGRVGLMVRLAGSTRPVLLDFVNTC